MILANAKHSPDYGLVRDVLALGDEGMVAKFQHADIMTGLTPRIEHVVGLTKRGVTWYTLGRITRAAF